MRYTKIILIKMVTNSNMYVIVDLTLIPLGVDQSLAPAIAECLNIIQKANLDYKLHAYGTNISGEWDLVFATVKRCHEKIHEMGIVRITSTLKVGTRIDKKQTLQQRVDSVLNHLNPQ